MPRHRRESKPDRIDEGDSKVEIFRITLISGGVEDAIVVSIRRDRSIDRRIARRAGRAVGDDERHLGGLHEQRTVPGRAAV